MAEVTLLEASSSDWDIIWPIFQEVVADEDTFLYPADIGKDAAFQVWFQPGARVCNAFVGHELVASRYIVPNKPGLGSHVCNVGVIIAKA